MSKATYHKELILSIKQEISKRNLTQQEVYTLLTENGYYISKDTLGHLLRKGSEDKKYKYDGCLQALSEFFVIEKKPAPIETLDSVEEAQQYIDQIEALQAVADAKKTLIEDLKEDLKEAQPSSDAPSPSEIIPKIEELQASEDSKQTILEELQTDMATLQKMIADYHALILRLDEEKRQLLEHHQREIAAYREETKRATDHLVSEIEYLRRDNERKASIVDKYYARLERT